MTIGALQQELLEIISILAIESNDKAIKTKLERALKIITELGKDHINDDIKINDNLKITVLDCIVRYDTQGYNSNNPERINNLALIEIENAIINIGGKTSQELGREQSVEELQSISDEDFYHLVRTILENLANEIEQLRGAKESLESGRESMRESMEEFNGFLDKQQKSCDKAIKFYALALPALFGAFIGGGLAKDNPILGLVIGALAGIIVVGVPLILYLEKNYFSTSTNLKDTTAEQSNPTRPLPCCV